jgi:hypothetical protein
MKIKLLLIVALIVGFSSMVPAQSVTVTPRKVTYTRPKPLAAHKKSFTVNYPKIKASNAVLSKKIENSLSYERIFNFKINEEIREVQWLEEANFEVDYNKNGILGLTMWIEGSGAYHWGVSKPIVINLKTGTRVRPQDVFTRLTELIAKGRNAQRAEIKKAISVIKRENPEEQNPAQLFSNARFTLKDLNEFSVNDEGVTFWYDYGFPHVIKALQPEGRYFFSWSELKPFIKADGLLAQFVR